MNLRGTGRAVRKFGSYPVVIFWVVITLLVSSLLMMQALKPDPPGTGGADVARSENGYTVVWNSSSRTLYRWHIPGANRTLLLRRGAAGLILAQHAYWYDREVGSIDYRDDDYGYALRRIAGSYSYSNHSSGTAMDLNFLSHPRGSYNYDSSDMAKIDERLELMRGVIRWGGRYSYPDEMHWEIHASASQVNALSDWLKSTYYGKKLLAANPNR